MSKGQYQSFSAELAKRSYIIHIPRDVMDILRRADADFIPQKRLDVSIVHETTAFDVEVNYKHFFISYDVREEDYPEQIEEHINKLIAKRLDYADLRM